MMLASITLVLLAATNIVQGDGDTEKAARECVKLLQQKFRAATCCVEVEEAMKKSNLHDPEEHMDLSTCESAEALAEKHGVWKDGQIDYEAIEKKVEEMNKKHPDLKFATDIVQEKCGKGKYEELFPNDICDIHKHYTCILGNTFTLCKTWKTSEECKEVNHIIDSCKILFETK